MNWTEYDPAERDHGTESSRPDAVRAEQDICAKSFSSPASANHLLNYSAREFAVARRVDALFKAMASDFLLREQFITDPSTLINDYVLGGRLAPTQAACWNQLIYAVFANTCLVAWLRQYAVDMRAGYLDQDGQSHAFLNDLCAAIASTNAIDVIRSLFLPCQFIREVLADPAFLYALFGGRRCMTASMRPAEASEATSGGDDGRKLSSDNAGRSSYTGENRILGRKRAEYQSDSWARPFGLFGQPEAVLTLTSLVRYAQHLIRSNAFG